MLFLSSETVSLWNGMHHLWRLFCVEWYDRITYGEPERTGKELVILKQSPRGTEETMKDINQPSRTPAEIQTNYPEYKWKVSLPE
jgi:hypothetical protein